jgi:hypothetical protein
LPIKKNTSEIGSSRRGHNNYPNDKPNNPNSNNGIIKKCTEIKDIDCLLCDKKNTKHSIYDAIFRRNEIISKSYRHICLFT